MNQLKISYFKRLNFQLNRFPKTPATDSLCEHSENAEAFAVIKYLSLTMPLMYLARFTWPIDACYLYILLLVVKSPLLKTFPNSCVLFVVLLKLDCNLLLLMI